MRDCRFDERIAHLNISYEPDSVLAEKFGPIRVALPGSTVNMTAEQAEIAAGFFMGVAAIAKRDQVVMLRDFLDSVLREKEVKE